LYSHKWGIESNGVGNTNDSQLKFDPAINKVEWKSGFVSESKPQTFRIALWPLILGELQTNEGFPASTDN
jgi:hypothetical protein